MNLIIFFASLFFILANETMSQTDQVYHYIGKDNKSNKITFKVNLLSIQGLQPTAFSFYPKKRKLYVGNFGSDSMSVIDTNNFSLMEPFDIKLHKPVAVTSNTDGSILYILNCERSHQSITEITTESSRIKKNKDILLSAESPMNMLMSKDDSFFYIADMIGNAVYKISVENGNVVDRFETDAGPTPMALSNDGKILYVANTDRNTIIRINTQTFKQEGEEILADGLPYTMVLSPDGKTLYVGNRRGNSIIFIDTESFKVIGEPFFQDIYNPRDLVVSNDGKILFVANKDDDSVTLIDTTSRKVIGNPIKTKGDTPLALCLDQKSDSEMDLYVANYNSHTVAKVSISIS